MIGLMVPSAFADQHVTGKWLDDFQFIDVAECGEEKGLQHIHMRTNVEILAEVLPADPKVYERIGVKVTAPDVTFDEEQQKRWVSHKMNNVVCAMDDVYNNSWGIGFPNSCSKTAGSGAYNGEDDWKPRGLIWFGDPIGDKELYQGGFDWREKDYHGKPNPDGGWIINEPRRSNGVYTFELSYVDDNGIRKILDTERKELHFKNLYEECSGTEVYDWALNNADYPSGSSGSVTPRYFGSLSAPPNTVINPSTVLVPTWIKNNAGWWADGTIDDLSFVQGIQFMIKENIISIPNLPESSSETTESVPAWIKNNAGWWAEGQIDDNSFVKGIEYLVKVGIIQVS